MDGHAIYILSIMWRQPFKFASSNLEPMDARRCNFSSLRHRARLPSLIPASTLSIDPATRLKRCLFLGGLNIRSAWLGHRHAGIFQPTFAACGSGFLSLSLVVSHHLVTYSFFLGLLDVSPWISRVLPLAQMIDEPPSHMTVSCTLLNCLLTISSVLPTCFPILTSPAFLNVPITRSAQFYPNFYPGYFAYLPISSILSPDANCISVR